MNGGSLVGTLLAALLGALGLWSYHAGLEARVASEPPGLVSGPGLLPGVDGDEDAEIRTPSLLALPSPAIRRAGSPARRRGAALMAAALGLAAFAGRRGGLAARAPRLLWVALGGGALWFLLARSSAGAASAAAAVDGFWSTAPLYGLALVLALAWRGAPPSGGKVREEPA